MKVALVTGGFDPIHSGHIALIQEARQFADYVFVGVNSDEWLKRKKGFNFLPVEERNKIVSAIAGVDEVFNWDDSAGDASGAILECIKRKATHVVFCNGGDRSSIDSLPTMEQVWAKRPECTFEFGVGGADKKNSSSAITENFKAPKTERVWGYYRVLHEAPGVKVKELTIDPGKSISMQKHKQRSELWLVSEGMCVLNSADDEQEPAVLAKHEIIVIPVGRWHQLVNPFPEPCSIVEIQYGLETEESDIERWKE